MKIPQFQTANQEIYRILRNTKINLLFSQQVATDHYPEPDESTLHLQTVFPKIRFKNIVSFTPKPSEHYPPFRFPNLIV
jgi:hypothetical protein